MTSAEARFPNLFLIGAMKAATTTVYGALAAHDHVFMSHVKEPQYFAFLHDKRHYGGPRDPYNNRYWVHRDRYLGLFRGAEASILGEASTVYLYHPDAASNILHQTPAARIIAILRDPALRAYSHYCFNRQFGREPESSFERALGLEDRRIGNGWGGDWHYRRRGSYQEQLRRYLALFPRDQILIALYDDLRADPPKFYRQLFRFLGLPDLTSYPAPLALNRTSAVRSLALAKFFLLVRETLPVPIRARVWNSMPIRLVRASLRPLYAFNLRPLEQPPAPTLAHLREHYEQDIAWLESFLDRDLSAWRGRASRATLTSSAAEPKSAAVRSLPSSG